MRGMLRRWLGIEELHGVVYHHRDDVLDLKYRVEELERRRRTEELERQRMTFEITKAFLGDPAHVPIANDGANAEGVHMPRPVNPHLGGA